MNKFRENPSQIRQALEKIWGYKNFRYPQEEIITSLLASKDALIILPTGIGKSICFQLPALLQRGLTIVISPLLALMENQVSQLQQRNLKAGIIHSELPKSHKIQTLQAIEKQTLRLLYLSPETLFSLPVWQILSQPNIKINGLIVDEVHCLVEWGDTFRPSYRRLGVVRETLLKDKPTDSKIPIAAFSATADTKSQQIIIDTLQLNHPQIFRLSFYRPNINLKIHCIYTNRCRKKQLLNFINTQKRPSGLIYVRTRKDSEKLAQWFRSLNYNISAYHAGLSPKQRRMIEKDWLEGRINFVVCTSAFGMGINKLDVGWVIHYQPPLLLSEYIQQVGRCGRDGKTANTLTLMSEPTGLLHPDDRQSREYFLDQVRKQERKAKEIARKIPSEGEIESIITRFPKGDLALAMLHSAGKLTWKNPFEYQISSQIRVNKPIEIFSQTKNEYQKMTKYLTTKKCRWQFLLNAFGFTQEALNFRCGHCDNCLK